MSNRPPAGIQSKSRACRSFLRIPREVGPQLYLLSFTERKGLVYMHALVVVIVLEVALGFNFARDVFRYVVSVEVAGLCSG
jgi:hypothetical protein